MEPLGQELSQKFGTPSVAAFPAGLSDTLRFLATAARACEADPAEAVAQERIKQESLIRDFADIAGLTVSPDPSAQGFIACSVVSEITDLLGITVAPDGTRVPMPITPPVGTRGIERMLHRWRRAIHA